MSTQAVAAPAVGVLGGLCNRTACRAPNAFWFNHSTRAHYCSTCATQINRANHTEAMELFGHALCTRVAPPVPASEPS